MITITEFEADFAREFPDSCEILKRGPLNVHEGVARITLHGSRGPTGGFTEDADIDLCLLVDAEQYPDLIHDEELVKEIMYTTLAEWREKIKPDVRVIFDTRRCDLKCFNEREYKPGICIGGGLDCFGIYEMTFGTPGYVLNSGMNVKSIYPCITVWKNPRLLRWR
jgi:hypothetical protein